MTAINHCCPVCSSNHQKEQIGEYYYRDFAKYFCPPTRNDDRFQRFANAIKRLWKQEKGYFLRCTNCKFGFGYPYVGGDEEFYQIVHEQAEYPSNRWEYDVTVRDLFKQEAPKKILDIGAGTGFFLDKIDCNEKFAMEGSDTTRLILKGKGIAVYDDTELLISEHAGSFNYITLFQVLEHIADFEKIFQMSALLLDKNGLLIISVPECDAMILQEKLTGYPDLFPNHINKWTEASLSLALEKHGLKTIETIYEPPSFKKFMGSVSLKVSHKATRKGSIASSIYKIKNKKIRIFFLAIYSFCELPLLLYNYKKLDRAGSFLLKARNCNVS